MQTDDLQVVLKVAEFRSITAAATHLDMQTATASAAVKRVESALGVELFVRTTRQLRLSSAGERYLPQCEEALKMLEKAKSSYEELRKKYPATIVKRDETMEQLKLRQLDADIEVAQQSYTRLRSEQQWIMDALLSGQPETEIAWVGVRVKLSKPEERL